MKIKYILFQFLALAVTLFAVQQLVGGFAISKAFSFAFMFWVIFLSTALAAPKVRAFFLLPSGVFFNAVIHTLLIGVVFWLCSAVIGGVSIVPVKFLTIEFLGILIKGTTLGSFGTITVVSIFIGTLYQLIIWLQSEK